MCNRNNLQSRGSVGCPPLRSGQSGHNDEGRAGRDARQEINTSGNKMQTQQLLQRNWFGACVCVRERVCVCVWLSGWASACDSACEVHLKSPVEKGELKQITFSNKVSVQIYLCVVEGGGRVGRWCSSHNQRIIWLSSKAFPRRKQENTGVQLWRGNNAGIFYCEQENKGDVEEEGDMRI